MSSQTPEMHTVQQYNVGIICALAMEMMAVKAMLDNKHAALKTPLSNEYACQLGIIHGFNVVIICLPMSKIGTSPAAAAVSKMTAEFSSIKLVLMVGIAGGIPPKVRKGDVVVTVPHLCCPGVTQWDLGTATEGGKFTLKGSLNKPPKLGLAIVNLLQMKHEMEGTDIPKYLNDLAQSYPKMASIYLKSDKLQDVLYQSDYIHVPEKGNTDNNEGDVCSSCDKTKIVQRRPRDMQVHHGAIATGNAIIRDAALRDKLNKNLGGNILAIEMEAGGLMNNCPCVVIRGIANYCDSHKDKTWQAHAAANAAAVAKEFLGCMQLNGTTLDTEPSVKDLIGHLHDDVKSMKSYVSTKEDSIVLNWLTPIIFGAKQSDALRLRVPNTGKWLLESQAFEEWVTTEKQTLFCPGMPGAGKTVIAAVVIEELVKLFRDSDNQIGIAYIYCDFRDPATQVVDALLASLARQLSANGLPDVVKQLHDTHNTHGTRPSLDEITKCLHAIAGLYSRVFIVVDALDECHVEKDSRSRFVSAVLDLQVQCPVSFFATSRNIPNVTNMFNDSPKLEIRATSDDVRRYLDGRMHELVDSDEMTFDSDLREEIKTRIIEANDGMFLLAKLHFDPLTEMSRPKDIRTALASLATGVDAYDKVYAGVMERFQRQSSYQIKDAKKLLSLVIHAKRPLSVSEIQHALAIEDGRTNLDPENLPSVKFIVSSCFGLAEIDEESQIVRLVHITVQEFFLRTHEDWFENHTNWIAQIFLTYLSFDEFSSGPSRSDKELEERLERNPLYKYVTCNWGYHVQEASLPIPAVMRFLGKKATLEAASQVLQTEKFWTIRGRGERGRSQRYAKNATGLHLIAYFGINNVMGNLINDDGPYTKDINSKTSFNGTPLVWAVLNHKEAAARLLVEKGAHTDVKMHGMYKTILHYVIDIRYLSIAKLLIENKADVNGSDGSDGCLLFIAMHNGDEEMVELLLDNGCNIEQDERQETSPLCYAIEHKMKSMVKLLLRKGASIEAQSRNDPTPLIYAIQRGNLTMIKLLLKRGASTKTRNLGGSHDMQLTPLLWVMEQLCAWPIFWWGSSDLVSWKSKKESVAHAATKLLLQSGADIEAKNNISGRTSLSFAAEEGSLAIVKLLLEKGASAYCYDNQGHSPAAYAMSNRHGQVCGLLLEKELEEKEAENEMEEKMYAESLRAEEEAEKGPEKESDWEKEE